MIRRIEMGEAVRMVADLNESIDHYINAELAEILHAKNGEIKMSQWFEAQRYIELQDFYEKALVIMNTMV